MTTYATYKQHARDALVLHTLSVSHLNRRVAANTLGVSLRTLLYWLQDMRQRGVDVPSRRAA